MKGCACLRPGVKDLDLKIRNRGLNSRCCPGVLLPMVTEGLAPGRPSLEDPWLTAGSMCGSGGHLTSGRSPDSHHPGRVHCASRLQRLSLRLSSARGAAGSPEDEGAGAEMCETLSPLRPCSSPQSCRTTPVSTLSGPAMSPHAACSHHWRTLTSILSPGLHSNSAKERVLFPCFIHEKTRRQVQDPAAVKWPTLGWAFWSCVSFQTVSELPTPQL